MWQCKKHGKANSESTYCYGCEVALKRNDLSDCDYEYDPRDDYAVEWVKK